jgi:LPXTG-motif cell wall-anchored protein
MSKLSIFGVAVAALMAVMTPAPVSGVTYDKLAYLTFSAPVQIPGVTLNAGTYRFRLTNPDTSRNVLQVLSNDGAIVYAMFHTIPDSRASVTENPLVTFRETPAGVPLAVKSLFYGGEHRGWEFVYPKGGPIMIAEVVPQPAITYTPYPPAAAPEPIAEVAAEPVGEPAFEPFVEPAAEPLPLAEPAALPRTGSPVPLMAVGGLTALIAGLGLGLRRRRAN